MQANRFTDLFAFAESVTKPLFDAHVGNDLFDAVERQRSYTDVIFVYSLDESRKEATLRAFNRASIDSRSPLFDKQAVGISAGAEICYRNSVWFAKDLVGGVMTWFAHVEYIAEHRPEICVNPHAPIFTLSLDKMVHIPGMNHKEECR